MKGGDKIRILSMEGEPQYTGKEGVIERISVDPWGDTAYYGTWVAVRFTCQQVMWLKS